MTVEVRSWFGPWRVVSEAEARDFALRMYRNAPCKSHIEEVIDRHLRGVTSRELFGDTTARQEVDE